MPPGVLRLALPHGGQLGGALNNAIHLTYTEILRNINKHIQASTTTNGCDQMWVLRIFVLGVQATEPTYQRTLNVLKRLDHEINAAFETSGTGGFEQ